MIQNITLNVAVKPVLLCSRAPSDFSRFFVSPPQHSSSPEENAFRFCSSIAKEKIVGVKPMPVPEYVHRLMKNGFFLLDEEKGLGYVLPKGSVQLKAALSAENLRFVRSKISEIEKGFTEEEKNYIKMNSAKSDLGIEIQINEIHVLFEVGQCFKNMKRSVEYLQEQFGLDKSFWDLSDEENLQILLNTHRVLFEGLPAGSELLEWRRQEVIVLDRGVDPKQQDLFLQFVKQKGGSKADVKLMQDFLVSGRIAQRLLYTEEDKRILNRFSFLPVIASEVLASMRHFVHELKGQYHALQALGIKVDYIALAAFAHERITAIHPFGDGNGRLARIVMNTLLMQGGHRPVFFPCDDAYTKEVRLADKDPWSFIQYLKQGIQMVQELQEELS